MPASANIQSGSVATFQVKVGESTIPDELRVFSVHVEKRVNRIPRAKIIILDGQATTGKFHASSSDTFLPGAKVTIEAGYDATNEVIFTGIITGQSLRIDELIGSALEVECRDLAIQMTVGRKSLTFANKKDSEIIASIIATYQPDLSSEVTETTTVWPEQVQYYVTDWDYILARAEINGLLLTVLNSKVSVMKPDADTASVLTVEFGDNLLAFNADLNALTQLGRAQATTWDYKNQVLSTAAAANAYAGPGNLSSETLSEVIGLPAYQLQTTAPVAGADLADWSNAQLTRSGYAKIQGEARFQGTSRVNPGNYLTLQGLGDRFNGDHLVSGVVHDFSDGNWTTEAAIGLSPVWFIEEPDVMSPPAAGLLPGVRGLFNGTVKKMYEDPDTQFRILVEVPLFDPNGAGIWARLANFYATSGAGAFFLPEVGDEVVLGFLNEDPRYPIILGSLYSSTKQAPYPTLTPNEKNAVKAIVSRSGIAVEFDDEHQVFTLVTPGKNTLVISDKDKQITIQDQNENSIVLSAEGITIKSAKDITIQAGQKLNLMGTQGISLQSSGGDVEVSGINIKETADIQYSAAGNEITTINSGTELSLKSAMILIN
jgi:Rhs element Vgr protein